MIFNSEKYRNPSGNPRGVFGKRVRFQDIPQHCTRAERSVDSSFISYNGARSQPVSRGFSASCLHRAGHAGRAQILGRRAPRPEGTHLRDPPPGKLFPFPNKKEIATNSTIIHSLFLVARSGWRATRRSTVFKIKNFRAVVDCRIRSWALARCSSQTPTR